MYHPTQAVILAGGRGTRLRPLTDDRPKPMIQIQGKPYLEHLIEMLREQGIKRILLLLGYLPQVVQEYFGDGSRWGIDIQYSVSAADDETGRRLKIAQPYLDPCFLLLYCDNYWPMPMEKMWQRYKTANVPAMITIYRNSDAYTNNNVRVDQDGYVTSYAKGMQDTTLQGVEIGFAFLSKSVVEMLPDGNVSFEATIYPRLAAQRLLLAYVTDHRYYSIGSHRRLPLTEAFFLRRPTVILDRDGVLNRKLPRATYVTKWSEFEWLPGAKEALRILKQADYRVIVVTNQAGVARGAMTEHDLHEIHRIMSGEVAEAGGHIERIYYCPHDWNEGCECRKPKPGMLFQAQRDYHLDLSRTFFIGDDERDAEAADAADCLSKLVTSGEGLLDVSRKLVKETADKFTFRTFPTLPLIS